MIGLILATALCTQADWTTAYERSAHMDTGGYAEAVEYCERLAAASPHAEIVRFGRSGQGRDLVALVMSKDADLTPASAARSSKPLILINNGIHPGEIEGKDAGLIMCREMLITKSEDALLDGANIIFIPIFNVDGHERTGPYNRINQNGPREMGWRTTGTNLNLNRDFIKADSPEMRAWLSLYHEWRPDFFFDNHTTNGGDWQYDMHYSIPTAPTQDPKIADWSRKMIGHVSAAFGRRGYVIGPYFEEINHDDPSEGLVMGDYGPRYSEGYGFATNRPALLVETHMLKPYKRRVEATYDFNKLVIEHCISTASDLKSAIRAADEASLAGLKEVILSAKTREDWRPWTYRGFKYAPYESEISGAKIPAWEPTPVDVESRIRDQFEPDVVVQMPIAYAIPPQWEEVIERLDAHGISYSRLPEEMEGEFESYRFENVEFAATPNEGRTMIKFTTVGISERRILPAGTVIVPVAQIRGKLIAHLLEPQAPDSLVSWGFFNTIFQNPEYFEDYAMEPVARKMLDADPELRRIFEEKLQDPVFAGNPKARLQFFYERSPYFDERFNKYPVVRLKVA